MLTYNIQEKGGRGLGSTVRGFFKKDFYIYRISRCIKKKGSETRDCFKDECEARVVTYIACIGVKNNIVRSKKYT